MAGYILLHEYYTLFSFSSPLPLPLLSGFIYLISGLLVSTWSILALRHYHRISICIASLLALSLGIALIVLGGVFFTNAIQQLPNFGQSLYQLLPL
ncbi:hypothetical protein KDA_05720 [Dictyobacter alpinus]|uniref:Uncharacterized protein n=2 Tax=Dictyobacter alpinus TaxID=2014873 RepID=A0A402B173_9CHLR|nr:hypothetical protein KDA_05720 [Dictyobacter alpinus]